MQLICKRYVIDKHGKNHCFSPLSPHQLLNQVGRKHVNIWYSGAWKKY